MVPLLPRGRAFAAIDRHAIQAMLQAVATHGQEEQPELFRHVHPHGHATAKLARSFASALGCVDGSFGPTLSEIELGAHLHDIGKYLIAKSILLKPGPLSEEERAAVSLHPVYGAKILSNLPAITNTILEIVLYHHERWDGTGYPEGLKGAQIPLSARLVSIVDVYTSLRSKRAYKTSLTRYQAATTLEGMAGSALDPDMTEDFLNFIGAY
jgi:HD-GYP domain-containing protein (c-di-GMP phosphodiesterase class II)